MLAQRLQAKPEPHEDPLPVAAISCSEWGGRKQPSSFGHSSGERKLATVA